MHAAFCGAHLATAGAKLYPVLCGGVQQGGHVQRGLLILPCLLQCLVLFAVRRVRAFDMLTGLLPSIARRGLLAVQTTQHPAQRHPTVGWDKVFLKPACIDTNTVTDS